MARRSARWSVGCTRQTVTRYLDLYPELRETAQDEGGLALDLTEHSLFLDAASHDPEARQYLLLTRGRDRDYIPRREMVTATGQPLNPAEQPNTVIVVDEPKEQYLERLRQMRELARAGQSTRLDARSALPPGDGKGHNGDVPG